MRNKKQVFALLFVLVIYNACKMPTVAHKTENKSMPKAYLTNNDSTNIAHLKWNQYFKDTFLTALIDSALKNNQELNIIMQEIQIAKNEVRARKGAYLPSVRIGTGAGIEKVGRYTSQGANDANTDIAPGKKTPEPLGNLGFGAVASWELDIWKKLRNSKQSAIRRYLASVDGKNFMITHLISEISNSYYELMALDNQLEILKSNIEIQQNALEIVKLQKTAAKVTELAVRKFEAEVLKNQSHQYYLMQQIVETENRINFLVGRFPQSVLRDPKLFSNLTIDSIYAGVPIQLLDNRPDIQQAEQLLSAAKLDVKVAKAEFYPSLMIVAGAGFQGFNPKYLLKTPESLIYTLAGDLLAPLINRNAIKANYSSANYKQVQAVYNYERTLLNAYIEVTNQLSNVGNLKKSYDLKEKQVQALTQSIEISIILFKSARADYMEVLLTQRDALESKFELIETKRQQLNAMVNMYRALGGGWK